MIVNKIQLSSGWHGSGCVKPRFILFYFSAMHFPKDLNLDEYECEDDEFLNPVSKLKIYSPNLHSPSSKDNLPSLLQHTERSKFFSTD